MNGLFARAVAYPGRGPYPAWIQDIVGPFRRGAVLPQPAAVSVKRTMRLLLRKIRMFRTAIRFDSLGAIMDSFRRGDRDAASLAFACQWDVGDCIRAAFGNLLASPDYAQHSAWALAWARWASEPWQEALGARFGKLGELIADNLAACLKHELLFADAGFAEGAGLMRGWSEFFLRGNFPGGIFRRGVFVVFVA